MTSSPSFSHLIILHTSCGLSGEGSDSRDAIDTKTDQSRPNWNLDNGTRTNGNLDWSTPHTIACDLLLLPEIPTDDDTVSMIRLAQHDTSWNQCGIPNVLVLREGLSWSTVILSLTSCVLFLDDRAVPANAVPSTFAFDISKGFEVDLYVAVEVDPLDLQDFLSRSVELQQEHVELDADVAKEPLASTSRSDGQACQVKDTFLGTEDHVARERSQYRLERELEALQQVQAIMDHDSANLDLLLQVLLWIGCSLLVTLLWSGYQLYRTKRQESRQYNLRRSARRKMLMQSELSASPLMAIQKEASKDPSTPRIDNRSRSRIDLATQPITPTRLDFSSAVHEVSPPPPASTRDHAPSVDVEPKPPSNPHNPSEIHCQSSSSATAHSVPTFRGAHTNPNDLFASTFGGKAHPLPLGRGACETNSLSPTSQLAHTWAASKSIRRRARKIKPVPPRGDLGPLFASPVTADSTTPTHEQQASPLLLAPIPDLVCSTPGSADSFVEDYW